MIDFSNIWAIARTESRLTRRLARFWVFGVISALFALLAPAWQPALALRAAASDDPLVQEGSRLAERIKDDITNLPDISLAEIRGMRSPEIHVEISENSLRRYGLTLDQVAEAVRRASLDLPAGRINTAGGEILIRTKGRRYFADEYRDVAVITRTDGSKVTLGQIAELRDGFEDVDISGRFMSKPAAMIHIYRVADQNALQVAKTVKRTSVT